MEIMPTCNTSTLDVYVPSSANPWDTQKVQHALRRLGFGGTKTEIVVLEGQLELGHHRRAPMRSQNCDATLVERTGHSLTLVDGEPNNIKVTTPADLLVAETLLAAD